MEMVHTLDYVDFSIDNENQVFVITWHQESGEISAEEYKNSALVFKKVYSKYMGKHILHDMRNFTYLITPEEQNWIAEEIMADLVANYSLTKMAFILPKEDLFSMISTQQASEEIEEVADDVFRSHFFDDPVEGIKWLLG